MTILGASRTDRIDDANRSITRQPVACRTRRDGREDKILGQQQLYNLADDVLEYQLLDHRIFLRL
jgi:hypothetical protein